MLHFTVFWRKYKPLVLEYHVNLTKQKLKKKEKLKPMFLQTLFIDGNNTKPAVHTLFFSENERRVS